MLIQHEKYNTEKYKQTKNNTNVQREVELSLPELSMMEKGPKQQFIDIWPIPFNLIGQYYLLRLKIIGNDKKSRRKFNSLTLRKFLNKHGQITR